MIGNMTKGTSFGGALKYDLEKEQGKLLETSCLANTWQDIAKEMEDYASINHRCKQVCLHLSISAPPRELLTDQQWCDVTHIAMKSLGLQNHQYTLTRHYDKPHDHCHLAINRIAPDGKAWDASNDFKKVHEAMREVENALQLQPLSQNQTQAQGRFAEVKVVVQDSIKISKGKGLEALRYALDQQGYTLIENMQSTGRIAGISLQSQTDGKVWKSSQLVSGGWRAIEKEICFTPQSQHGTQRLAHSRFMTSTASSDAGGGGSSAMGRHMRYALSKPNPSQCEIQQAAIKDEMEALLEKSNISNELEIE